jgi:hypothetical protein
MLTANNVGTHDTRGRVERIYSWIDVQLTNSMEQHGDSIQWAKVAAGWVWSSAGTYK